MGLQELPTQSRDIPASSLMQPSQQWSRPRCRRFFSKLLEPSERSKIECAKSISICYRLYGAWHSNWKPKSDTISFAQNIPLEA